MPIKLLCPNCSKPMKFARALANEGKKDTNVYECGTCHLAFLTEDHCTIAGVKA